MSRCLYKLPHSCGSSDALQVYEGEDGSITGYCWACNKYVADPEEGGTVKVDKPPAKTREQILEEMEFISTLPTLDLDDRMLKAPALAHYWVRVGLSEFDGKTPAFAYFPYTRDGKVVRYKVKPLYESRCKSWSVGIDNQVDLFGWEQAKVSGARRLIITEGEFDAIALAKILKMHTTAQYQEMMPAIVSIPNGAGAAAKDISRLLPELRKHFKEISLCFDNDEAGQAATEAVCKIAPDFKVIHLPMKDANECLIKGAGKQVYKSVTFQSEKPKNTKLVWGADVEEKAMETPEFGLSWPWPKMTDLTRGIRWGETIYIAAAEKMGKSELLNSIAVHMMVEHGKKVFMAKPEEANAKTHKLLCGKVEGKMFHDPKVQYSKEDFLRASAKIKHMYCMLDLYQNITWPVLKADLYEAANSDIKVAFIDPITNLTNGMSASQGNEFLAGFAQDVSTLAKDLDMAIFLFCHLNKPAKGNTPFDRGGTVTTDYFAGSSAMARSCNYAIAIQGDRDPEKPPEQRNIRDLVILADREYGEVGKVSLYWDWKTGLFNEV